MSTLYVVLQGEKVRNTMGKLEQAKGTQAWELGDKWLFQIVWSE